MSKRTSDFYVHMTRIFRNAWTSTYGETDDGTWAAIVGPMSPGTVKAGLRSMLRDWTDSFPPTPAQFRQVARDNIRPEHQPLSDTKQLEHLPSDPEDAAAHIKALRELLR